MFPLILRLPCIPFISNNFSSHIPRYSQQPQHITQTNYLTSGDNPIPTAPDKKKHGMWGSTLYYCATSYVKYTNKCQPFRL